MRRAYSKNALDNIDSWITRDNRQELPEEVYTIDGYEEYGTFETYEDALQFFMMNHKNDDDYPQDYIYKVKEW